MSYPLSLNQSTKQTQSLKQQQRLMMSPQMKQAIALLQAPILEMAAIVQEELEQNPILEYQEDADSKDSKAEEAAPDTEMPTEQSLDFQTPDHDILQRIDQEFLDHFAQSESHFSYRDKEREKAHAYLEDSLVNQPSLYSVLNEQARQTFESEAELEMATEIIGNFDNNGYLTTPLEEIGALNHYPMPKLRKILERIQEFQPSGVGASTLQEALLIQLKNLHKEKTIAFTIISDCFDDFLHNRIPVITKKLKCTAEDIDQAIKRDLAALSLHPGNQCMPAPIHPIVPEATIKQEDDKLVVYLNENDVPQIRANRLYLKMLYDPTVPEETKEFIKNRLISAKWLIRNIFQRNETIRKIAEFLAEKQREFFIHPQGKLNPLTMKTVAEALDLHESTIARAVAHKAIETPRGLLPLRYFFSGAFQSEQGEEVSAKTVRELLQEMIDMEDKRKPLSDEALSEKLKEQGIPCARRTVAKYRSELNLGNTQQRKKY